MVQEMISSHSIQHSNHYVYRGSWVQLFRPMTLTGTITPVLVGTGFAAKNGAIHLNVFFAVLIAALLIQSSTNVLNDFFDFKYGQDNEKWILIQDISHKHGPAHKKLPFIAGIMIFSAIIIGLWLAFANSVNTLWIVITGILGILAGIKYSAGKHSFASIGLGETVAFLFLGPVITTLAYIVQENVLDFHILIISLPFAFLIASMILTNNIRDLKKDFDFRTTLANILGKAQAVYLLITLLSSAYITILLLILYQVLPFSALIVSLALPLAGRLIWCFRKNSKPDEEFEGMKWAAMHHWAFGLLLAFALLILN